MLYCYTHYRRYVSIGDSVITVHKVFYSLLWFHQYLAKSAFSLDNLEWKGETMFLNSLGQSCSSGWKQSFSPFQTLSWRFSLFLFQLDSRYLLLLFTLTFLPIFRKSHSILRYWDILQNLGTLKEQFIW